VMIDVDIAHDHIALIMPKMVGPICGVYDESWIYFSTEDAVLHEIVLIDINTE